MCDHSIQIFDSISADCVCSLCAHVLYKDYSSPKFIPEEEYHPQWSSFFLNCCANMNIADGIASEALTLFNKRNTKSIRGKKKALAAYTLYETMLKHNVGKTVEEISFYTEVTTKAIWSVEKTFQCPYSDCVENYVEKLCYFLDLTRRDAAQIRKIISNNELDIVDGRRPQNIAVALIYYYCDKKEMSKSLKNVCTVCNVSISSVQQILKKLRNIEICI